MGKQFYRIPKGEIFFVLCVSSQNISNFSGTKYLNLLSQLSQSTQTQSNIQTTTTSTLISTTTELTQTKNKSTNLIKSNNNNNNNYKIPETELEKQQLLEWAYSEAVSLIKRYGDVIEEINDYFLTGSTTSGECVMLIESKLIN